MHNNSQSPEEVPELRNNGVSDLKARLFDKGFKVGTMPSVKRPDTKQSQDKMLTAKLTSLKSRTQKLEPMVYQKQSTVLHSQIEHVRMTQGAFFQNADTQRPGGNNKQVSGTGFNNNQEGSRGQNRDALGKATSMMNIPRNLPPIPHEESMMTQSRLLQQQMKDPLRMTLGTLGFSQNEMHRTKYLVDKVSGKFNIDKRYLAMMPEEEQIYIMGKTFQKQVLQKTIEQDEIVEEVEGIEQQPKHAPSKLDKYIDLILKNVTNVDEFIYLKREEDGEDDPYKLIVVDYKTIKGDEKTRELKEYYTISRKGLCHYMNGKPIEFIQLAYWLKERETYHQIKSLKFFTKFRKWKTLKQWKQNVIRHKTANCAKSLEDKLFNLNPILRETLLGVRKNTYDMMETSRFIGFDSQQYGAQSEDGILTLEEFKIIQEMYRKKVNDRIRTYSNECRKIVQVGFDKSLDILRKNHYVANNEEEFGGGAGAAKSGAAGSNFFRLKESAYENLNFPDNMTYEKRSELRKECSKFIRFSYLMDFLSMEALSNIYTLSVRDLITKLQSLVDIEESYILKDPANRIGVRFDEPLFQIKLESNFIEIPESQLVEEDVPEFIPPPFGNSKLEEFKLLYHVHLIEDKPKVDVVVAVEDKKKKKGKDDEEEDEEEEEDPGGFDENRVYKSVTIPNICKLWINMKPGLDLFYSDIVRCIGEGLNSIQAFERWSRHDDMTQYVSVLEEWDDMVGEDWEHPDSNYLNPQDWLDASPFETFSGLVRQLLEKAFDRSQKYIEKEFTKNLLIYWENKQLNLDIFINENLAHPGDTFQYALGVLNLQRDMFIKEIPFESYQGIFKIDSQQLKAKLEPQPQEIIKAFETMMTPLLRGRNKELKDWLQSSTSQLKGVTTNIDDFVKQSNSLKIIQKQLPKVKARIQLVGHIYNILDEYHIEIKKEDKQAYNVDIIQTQNTLEQAIHHAEEGAERNLERFARDITHSLIPKLEQAIGSLDSLVQQKKYTEAGLDLETAIKELSEYDEACKKLEEDAKRFSHYEKTLQMPISRFQTLEDLRSDLNLRYSMWRSLKEWKGLISSWIDGKFVDINTEEIRVKGEYYTKVVNRCQKSLPSNPILDELKHLVFSFKDTMPVVLALRNNNLQTYHWAAIMDVIGKQFEITDTFTLKNLMDMEVVMHQEQILQISTQATQEAVLEAAYNQIESQWKKLEFVVVPYKAENPKNKEVYVLSDIDDLFAALDEFLANLNNILGSRYLKLLRPKAEKLHKDVLYSQETLDDWLAVQKNWIYLENIFSSADIKTKLKDENLQFENVDKTFKQHMRRTNQGRLVHRVILPGLLEKFRESKDTLNKIQKALENYLEDKRNAFPRFYFLSNDELLEILAKSNDIDALQKNIKKCFEAIYRLDFGEEGSRTVQGMISPEGERVKFNKSAPAKAEVEQWLLMVQDYMVETLVRLMKTGKVEYENMERKNWVMGRSAQVVATVSNIMWTSYTEQAILGMNEDGNSLAEWYNHNYRQLSQLTELVRLGLTPLEHLVIVALITQDVHARDIVETLTDESVNTLQDFSWQQQLRYYWEEQIDNILVRQVNFSMRYGYEYLGATTRLVITPLTDRCWMTITGALNIQLGASPSGPAGTGKTESTKDLAKALGMFCVVFNCSDQIEFKMMARLFSGLAQQGAWSCLDEFNRIDIEVLSVIAQQLLTVRQALLRHDKRFFFADRDINLHPNFGVFVTMNPGYAGRTELPDNLKVLFRPVSMMIPDYRLIAEIMLFAEGFENAKPLSLKMTQLYKLSSEQLSQQDHYDFGMRAVKSVLVMAGKLKRAEPNLNEEVVLIRAMRDSNVPKFLLDDLPLFGALIGDLFPGVLIPDSDYGDLQTQIEKSLLDLGFQKVPELVTKVIQLFETFNVRFGVMLVGLTGSGKTTCYEVLQHTMSTLRKINHTDQRFQDTQTYILNPKCISMGELYGEVNSFTQEWQDGLASQIMREASADETQDKKWIVFDGPVDALWIENMNTVLDDNMMLCLANGQRIKLRPQMRMLFEVQDLRVASPATVSRCGMVYLTQEALGWKPYVQSWVERYFGVRTQQVSFTDQEVELLTADQRKYVLSLFEEYVDDILQRIRGKGWRETITTTDTQLVRGLCNLFEAFINEKFGFKASLTPEFKKRFITYSFTFAVIWSLGASIEETHHDAMNDFIRDRFQSIIFPNVDTVYAYYLETTGSELSFKHWNDKTPEFTYDPTTAFFNLLVPTIDTVRYSFIVDWLLVMNKLVYVTGASGTGKSQIVSNLLSEIQEIRGIDPIYLIFSAQTTSYVTQLTIEGKLEKIKKALLGAKPGRSSCIFIDDVNMPALEEFGAQPPIELLRLVVDKHFLYDRKERFQKFVENTTILCCSAPPGGGRNAITPRFTQHFNMISLPKPSDATLFKIFNSILTGFFSVGFMDAVKRCADTVVLSTIEIYVRISTEKLPIPSKFHYTFNLRDVSKVFQGLLMVKPVVIRDTETVIKLWLHEVSRVFYDRLINDEDRDWFKNLAVDLLGRQFKSRWGMEDVFGQQKILFGDLLRLDSESRDYEEIKDTAKLIKVLEEKLDDFNLDFNSKTKLVFFEDAIDHILRISRILRQPRGNAMLIGVGGSGKQSLTRLSAYMMGQATKCIEIKKNYGVDDFHEFVKELMKTCALDQTPLCFLFTDSQIVYESFLEDINNMLNSGEVPNLWNTDEKDPLLNGIRAINAKLKRPEDPDTLYKTFVEQVRDNLHITLCMSPVGDALRVRCRKFPALVDCCTLDWFSAWPPEALVSVAGQILNLDTSFPSGINLTQEQLIEKIALMCKQIHVSSTECALRFENALKRKVYTTPKSYLDLIGLYLSSLKRKREELQLNQRRLSSGLTKLEQANKQVAELQIVLTELKPELELSSIKVAEALVKVEADSFLAAEKEAVVQREAEEVNKKAQDIKIIADDASADLDKVMPELEKAQQAVENIDKNALTTIRSYLQPPPIVVLVLEGVCTLLGTKTDWPTAKGLLQDVNGFIQKLLTYPKDNIPDVRLNALKKILAKEEFNVEGIRGRAPAAADLCMWCIAMNIYSSVSRKIEPKKKKVAELTAVLDAAFKVLREKESELDIVKQAVSRLKKETDEMLQKKMDLERQKDLTEARLDRAKKLITLTADEAKRWAETVQTLGSEIENLVGDVFLSAAAISYNGPFTGPYRQELVVMWLQSVQELEIPVSDNFSVIRTLGDPMQLRDWMINGLPSDQVSQENSIFATQGYRWPLMIDPQMQANNWIRQANKANGIKVIKFIETTFQQHMKLALANGYVVLIQDIDETLDPSIETILGKQIKEVDGRILIRFGDQEIDYDKNFRLFITTKIPNPKYLPEIFIKVTVINFTVTFEGLEDQLLADVVKQERPEIEKQKDDNVMNLARYRKSIKESEATILRQLADAEAEKILDNVELIESLEYAKQTAFEINQKIAESTILEAEIERVRNEYRSISIRGSVLYFVIKDLSLVDPMYQYSLQYIQQLFNKAMKMSRVSTLLAERLSFLIDMITSVLYTNVCRGLFEEHKLIFSFLMAIQINRKVGLVLDAQWSVFLRGPGVLDKSKQLPNPDKTLIPDQAWDLACYLDKTMKEFNGLASHITKNLIFWREYTKAVDPITFYLNEWEEKLNLFERLLILKIFRGEKIMFAVSSYVLEYLGKYYLEPPKTTMDILYNDSDPGTPIIFVLSAGADPTSQVLRFAKEKEFEQKLCIISLGQGQGRVAQLAIDDAKMNGKWVLLQNCHLAKTWMPQLEIIVEQLAANARELNPEYRLILTSMPASYFPISILQNGIKLTTEPPRGLKANLKRSFQDISDEFLETCPKREIFHKLTFGLCYFHAIIQERKKFGPLGWNIRYEFNDSDLETSKTVVKMLLSEGEAVPWDAMLFVTGHINYGGRVTDEWDRRCLMTILKKFMTVDVLEDTYRFSENHVYYVPPVSEVNNYIEFIDKLPMADDPQVFGMHENANIAFQQQESDSMIRTILSIQPRETGAGEAKTPDQVVLELVKSIQDDLPQVINRMEGNKELWIINDKGLIPSLSTVLLQETTRFNVLLTTMTSTLASLAKAIQGILVMSQDLDSMYFSLLNNQVPKLWEKVSYLSLKGLASWIRDLKERVKFMQEWVITGGPNCFWISGFFYPQGFLTGVLQTHARKTGIAIDVLQFAFKILEMEKENCSMKPTDGVFIYGFFMEGAQWKKKTLTDTAQGQMYMQMPVIHFNPTDLYQANPANYNCPVYKTAVRAGQLSTTGQSTNFVLSVDVPSLEQTPEFWTLRGAALLCALRD